MPFQQSGPAYQRQPYPVEALLDLEVRFPLACSGIIKGAEYIPIGWLASIWFPYDLYPNFVMRDGKILQHRTQFQSTLVDGKIERNVPRKHGIHT